MNNSSLGKGKRTSKVGSDCTWEVLVTQLLQTHWEWQEDRRKERMAWQREETHCVRCPHGYQDGLQDESTLRELQVARTQVPSKSEREGQGFGEGERMVAVEVVVERGC